MKEEIEVNEPYMIHIACPNGCGKTGSYITMLDSYMLGFDATCMFPEQETVPRDLDLEDVVKFTLKENKRNKSNNWKRKKFWER